MKIELIDSERLLFDLIANSKLGPKRGREIETKVVLEKRRRRPYVCIVKESVTTHL